MSNESNRIKEAREAVGLTQGQLADLIGGERVSVSKWETGKSKPSGYVLDSIGYRTGFNPDWMRTGHGPKHLDGVAEQAIPHRSGALDSELLTADLTTAQQIVMHLFLEVLRIIPDESLLRWWARVKEAMAPKESRPTDTLAERLQTARRASGMTLEQVSRRLKSVRPDLPEMKPFEYEIDPAYLEAIEAGSIVPPPTLLANLAVVYRVPSSTFSISRPAEPEASDDDMAPQKEHPLP